MSTAKFDTLQNAAGSLSVPVATVVNGSAKAWVLFNGSGAVAVVTAFNVSSVTDNGTGDYTVNFATAMPDALYTTTYGCPETSGGSRSVGQNSNSVLKTVSAIRLLAQINNAPGDLDAISVVVHR